MPTIPNDESTRVLGGTRAHIKLVPVLQEHRMCAMGHMYGAGQLVPSLCEFPSNFGRNARNETSALHTGYTYSQAVAPAAAARPERQVPSSVYA